MKHRWKNMGGYWQCEKCGLQKTKIRADMRGWDYYNPITRKTVYTLPACNPESK